MRALDGPLAEVRGLRPEMTAYDGAAEHLQDVWVAARASLRGVLERVTLEDVVRGRFPAPVARLVVDPTPGYPRALVARNCHTGFVRSGSVMLYVHRSERADLLVDILGDILAEALPDPMASEVVAVPTRGVERWLTQRLSHRLGTGGRGGDGVCANVDFPFPGSLIGRATARACGWRNARDPWAPERLVWPLLEVVDDHFGDPFLEPLAAHLKAASPDQEAVRRYATVRHLADLYHHYGVHRPDLVQSWAEVSPGSGGWQEELWRRVRSRIGVASPPSASGPWQPGWWSRAAWRICRHGCRCSGSPACRRAIWWCWRRWLRARDVHLFLLHPSGALWDKVAGALAADPSTVDLHRAADPTARLPAHPLLRSWGRDAREMQLVLATHGAATGEYRPVPPDPSSLLGRIQADIRADRAPPPARPAGGADVGRRSTRPTTACASTRATAGSGRWR